MMNYSNIEQLTEGIDIVFDLYRNYGSHDYIGEDVTQLEHAFQCANQAAVEFPDNYEYILGAFLHDIGHLVSIHDTQHGESDRLMNFSNESLNGLGLVNHENIGADFLELMGFSKSVSALGRNHVLAKRYLITKNSEYLNNLSNASKETFKLQGGVLSNEEILQFESETDHLVFLRMRHWDDMAKDTNFNYKHNIDYYRDMAIKLLVTKNNIV